MELHERSARYLAYPFGEIFLINKTIALLAIVLALCHSTIAASIEDSFGEGTIDETLWNVIASGNVSAKCVEGKLRVETGRQETGKVDLKLKRLAVGDFTAEIDYSWLTCDGHKARMQTGAAYQGTPTFMLNLVRHGSKGENRWSAMSIGEEQTFLTRHVPDEGSLRISRVKRLFSVHIKGKLSEKWVELGSLVGHDSSVRIFIHCSNSDFAPLTIPEFDNFALNSDQLVRNVKQIEGR